MAPVSPGAKWKLLHRVANASPMKGPAMTRSVKAPISAGVRARRRPSSARRSMSALKVPAPLLDRSTLRRAITVLFQQFLACTALQELQELAGEGRLFAVLQRGGIEHQRLRAEGGLFPTR